MIPLWLSSLLGLILTCAGVGVLWLAVRSMHRARRVERIRVIPDRPRCDWCDGVSNDVCTCDEPCAFIWWCVPAMIAEGGGDEHPF